MPYRKLFLLVEGPDDVRFVDRVVVPRLTSRYDYIQTWEYARQKKEKVSAFLRSIKAMGAEYFFLADINSYSCFPEKREALVRTFDLLDAERVVIVIREIESWYLAGLSQNNPWALPVPADTGVVTKEQFDARMPKAVDSRIDYMIEVLKLFDVRAASAGNPSFDYFARRCGLLPP